MIRNGLLAALCCILIPPASSPAEPPSADELLARTIAYHDPQDRWARGAFRMTIVSKPEDGEQRTQEIVIDNARGRYELHETQDGRRIEQKLEGDTCAFSIDGSTDLTDKQLKKHRGGRSAFAAEPGLAHEQ